MDEECRKDLPLAQGIVYVGGMNVDIDMSEERKQSPQKSVRFTEEDQSSPDPMEDTSVKKRTSSRKKRRHAASDSEDPMSSERKSGLMSGTDDYGEEGDESSSDDDGVADHELQQKLENIKRNLKDASSQPIDYSQGLVQREQTMKNLEEVLKRQKERLEHVVNEPPHIENHRNYNQKSEGTQNSIKSGNLEQAYEDLEKEIKDIKSKLQQSMGAAPHHVH